MRWRAILDTRRLARASALAVLLTGCGLALGAEAPGKAAGRGRTGSTTVKRAALVTSDLGAADPAPAVPTATEEPGGRAAPRVEVTESEIHTDPPASPGATLGLEAGRKFQGMRLHWFQVEGPAVEISDPNGTSIRVTIPGGTARLGFVLVAAGADLVRVVRVSVPVQGSGAAASASGDVSRSRTTWGSSPSGKVRADAGDDQVGLVGHRVTLNGSRSVPGDGKSARWVQVGGPGVVAPEQQGAFFSFVPGTPGVYRFLLVVAVGGEVSEPDEVSVLVGTLPAGLAGAAPPTGPAPATVPAFAPVPPTPTPTAPDQILNGSLPGLADGTRVASDVADVMEAISDRAPLYSSFAVLQNELARRLDLVIPSDPAARAAWNQGVFTPLTAYTSGQFLTAGVDVRQPQGLHQPLTAAQRERVREHFQKLARAFRAAVASR